MSLPRRSFLHVVLAAALSAGIAVAVRLLLIEVHEIGQLCDPGTGPVWCLPRQAVIQLSIPRYPGGVGALGIAAIIAAGAALIQRSRSAIYIGACLGGFGCVLYDASLASIGLVLSLIAAARA